MKYRRYSADLVQGGMEIPFTLTFKINQHESEKTHKLINSTMKASKGKSVGNGKINTPVVEVKEEQKEPPNLSSES